MKQNDKNDGSDPMRFRHDKGGVEACLASILMAQQDQSESALNTLASLAGKDDWTTVTATTTCSQSTTTTDVRPNTSRGVMRATPVQPFFDFTQHGRGGHGSLYIEHTQEMQAITAACRSFCQNYYVYFGVGASDRREAMVTWAIEMSIVTLEDLAAPPKKKKKKKVVSATTSEERPAGEEPGAGGLVVCAMSEGARQDAKTGADQAAGAAMRTAEVSVVHMTTAQKATFYHYLGTLYSFHTQYHPLAEKYLTLAAKLQPHRVATWTTLGETYWKKSQVIVLGDGSAGSRTLGTAAAQQQQQQQQRKQSLLHHAKWCFEMSLKQERNKVALRLLSILYRALQSYASNATEAQNILTNALELAKEAVSLDIADAESWLTLGTSHLQVFFNASLHDPSGLQKSLAAYHQAEKKSARPIADLYYNRGIIHAYEQRYEEAMADFTRAKVVDPGMQGPVDHEVAKIHGMLAKVSIQLKRKGKKWQSACEEFQRELAAASPLLAHVQALFPQDRRVHTWRSLLPDAKIAATSMSRYQAKDRLLATKVVTELSPAIDALHRVYLLMDPAGHLVPCMVYHLKASVVRVGDRLLLRAPHVLPSTTLSAATDEPAMCFLRMDRVWEAPQAMWVNGTRMTWDHVQSCHLSATHGGT